MRVETIVDLVLLDGVPDTEFDDPEPDEPDFDEDFAPDFDFLMDAAAASALDFACANAH